MVMRISVPSANRPKPVQCNLRSAISVTPGLVINYSTLRLKEYLASYTSALWRTTYRRLFCEGEEPLTE